MIKFNEQSFSPSRISTSIKHRCKINSYYYYIQIYVDSIANSEKITFLIKSKKENERKTILFKRNFYYDELLNYNKYFKSFSSLEEIFINIANYAYTNETGNVEINTWKNGNELFIQFIDEGMPFNPLEAQKPNNNVPLEEMKVGGLGIFLTKQNMDSVDYKYENNKNILTLKKCL